MGETGRDWKPETGQEIWIRTLQPIWSLSHQCVLEGAGRWHVPRDAQKHDPRVDIRLSAGHWCPSTLPEDLWEPHKPQTHSFSHG